MQSGPTSSTMLALVAGLLLGLSMGCRDEGLMRLEAIRDELCRCETPSCGQEAMRKVEQLEVEGTPRSQRVAREMMDCLAELYAKDLPEAAPDVATPQPAP